MLKFILLAIFSIFCLLVIGIIGIYYILKTIFKDFTIDFDYDENEQLI